MSQPVKQAVNEATDRGVLNLWKGSLDDTHLTRTRRRLSLKDDEDQSSAVREWLNLETRQLSYSSSRSGQTSVVDLTGSDTEDANRQTERGIAVFSLSRERQSNSINPLASTSSNMIKRYATYSFSFKCSQLPRTTQEVHQKTFPSLAQLATSVQRNHKDNSN
ncbi:hypothetical protein AHF37_05774 [Paragonimus kellicotti]|nr:hypothetical protein AHF37_05774 [Paragonimus kellicotti]